MKGRDSGGTEGQSLTPQVVTLKTPGVVPGESPHPQNTAGSPPEYPIL